MSTCRRVSTVLCSLALVASSAHAEVKAGDRAADFDKQLAGGGHLKLSSLRGKVVLVDFWASWCEPCKKEIPLLDKLATKLRARGIEVVTVNIDDDTSKADRFLNDKGIRGLTVVRDDDKKIVGAWEPPKMPSSFIVDRGGVVRAVNAGFEDGDERKIEQQLLSLAGK
jgi:cytochrome c biogenesis protein CcmG/thiol:disulfide interchange protein DsbE